MPAAGSFTGVENAAPVKSGSQELETKGNRDWYDPSVKTSYVPRRAREVHVWPLGRSQASPSFRLFDGAGSTGSAAGDQRAAPPHAAPSSSRHVACQASPTLWSRYYFSQSSLVFPNDNRTDSKLVHYDVFIPESGPEPLAFDPRADAWGALPTPEAAVHMQKETLAVMEANLRAAPIEARRPTGHRDMQVGDEAGGLPEDIASIAPFVSARMNKHHLPTFARWVAALRPCSTQNTVESLRPVLTLSQGLLRDLVDGKIQFQDEEVRRARAECERRLVELREIHALEVSRMEERHAKAMEELMATYQTDVAERRKKMVLSAAFGAVDEARLIDEAVAESMAADELEKELSRLRETSEAEIARLKSDLEIQAKLKNELAENINVMRREHDTKRDELQHTIDELARKIELLNGQNFSLQSHIIDLEDELKRVPRQLPSPDVNLGDLLTTTAYRKIKSMSDVVRLTHVVLDRLYAKTKLNCYFLHLDDGVDTERGDNPKGAMLRYVAVDSRTNRRLPSLMGRKVPFKKPTSEGGGIVGLAIGETDAYEIGLVPRDERATGTMTSSGHRSFTGTKRMLLKHAMEENNKAMFIEALQPYGRDTVYVEDVRDITGIKFWRTETDARVPQGGDDAGAQGTPREHTEMEDERDHDAANTAAIVAPDDGGEDGESLPELEGIGDASWRPTEPYFFYAVASVANSTYAVDLRERPIGVLCCDNFEQLVERQNFASMTNDEAITVRHCATAIGNFYAAMTKNKLRSFRGFAGSMMYLSKDHIEKTKFWSDISEALASCRQKKQRVEAMLRDPATKAGLTEMKSYVRPIPEMVIILYHSLRLGRRFTTQLSRLDFNPHRAMNAYLQVLNNTKKKVGVDLRDVYIPADAKLKMQSLPDFSVKLWEHLKDLIVLDDTVEMTKEGRRVHKSFLNVLGAVDMVSVKYGTKDEFEAIVNDLRDVLEHVSESRAKRVGSVCELLRSWLSTCVEIYDCMVHIEELEKTGKDSWQKLMSEEEVAALGVENEEEAKRKAYVLSDESKAILDSAIANFRTPSASPEPSGEAGAGDGASSSAAASASK